MNPPLINKFLRQPAVAQRENLFVRVGELACAHKLFNAKSGYHTAGVILY